MEYTEQELESRITACQKNIDYLTENRSNINKLLKSEKEKLEYWKEIKVSKQKKLF